MYPTSDLINISEQSNLSVESTQIVFIDRQLADYELLAAGVRSEFEVYLLDPALDGVQQVTRVLGRQKLVQAIHLVSHGSSGRIQLGSADLSLETIDHYGQDLQQWSAKLAANATLTIYGCEVGKGDRGMALVYRLSEFLGASVAASKTNTGSQELDADWDLQVKTGKQFAPVAFTPEAMAAYQGVMPTIPGTPGPDNLKGDNNLLTLRLDDLIDGLAGDDTIDGGLGVDTVDGGAGNDLLIVDYSSNTFGSGNGVIGGIVSSITQNANGVNGNFRAYFSGNGTFDRVQFSNIERFQVTGTKFKDIIQTLAGNDTIASGGGADTLMGGGGNDLYIIDRTLGAGTVVDDSFGVNDSIDLGVGANYTTANLSRDGKNLIVDLNKDGIFNATNDLSIKNFFAATGNKAGNGYIENIANLSSATILNFYNLTLPIAIHNDFGNDGKSDILWRNSNGQVYTYQMNGFDVASEALLRNVSNDWEISGTGDFNGDGKSDILWRNNVTGLAYSWQLDSNTIVAEGAVRLVSKDWQIANTGDFNGDGKSDILWRNLVSGETYIYQMNGINTIGSEGSVRVVSKDWQIAGTGDFNGDGKSDILWRNSTTGETYLYLMNGLNVAQEGNVRTVNNDWVVTGINDFDGDGKSDILWRNSVSGDTYIYLMHGLTVAQEGIIGEPYTTSDHKRSYWKIVGTGDYNGDSKADILWQHDNGTSYIWNMDGLKLIGELSVRTNSPSWQVVPTVNVNFSNNWISTVDGNWTDGFNWSQGSAPIESDNVVVNTSPGTKAILANILNGSSSLTVNSLTTSGLGSLVLQSSNGSFQSQLKTKGDVTNSGNIDIQTGDLSVGGNLHNSGNIKINATGNSADYLSFSAPIAKIDGGGTITLSNTLPPYGVSFELQTGNDRLLAARPEQGQPTTILENVDNTITGTGHIGAASIRQYSFDDVYKGEGFINGAQGIIKITGSDYLEINTATLVNHGLIETTAADPQLGAYIDFATHSVLVITPFGTTLGRSIGVDIDNSDGLILADGPNAGIAFNGANVHGGTLQTKNGGNLFFDKWGLSAATQSFGVSKSPLLDGTTNAISIVGTNSAELGQVYTFDELLVQGRIQNHSTIHILVFNLTPPDQPVDRTGALSLSGDTNLSGGGSVSLERSGDALSNNLDVGIIGSGFNSGQNYTLTNVDNKIFGAGTIGYTPNLLHLDNFTPASRLTIVNEAAGQIVASASQTIGTDPFAAQLDIVNVDLTNKGLVAASGNGGLLITNSTIFNQGIFKADGGDITIQGDIDESNVLGGQIIATNGNTVTITGALQGNGNNQNLVSTGSVLKVGNFLNGDVTFSGLNNKLILDRSSNSTVLINDFVATDSLDLRDISFNNASFNYNGNGLLGILSVTDGSHTTNLNLQFSEPTGLTFNPNQYFSLSADTTGGTIISNSIEIGANNGNGSQLNNFGLLKIGPTGSIPNLVIDQESQLIGSGNVLLVGGAIISSSAVQASGTPVTFENQDNIISGSGTIGDDTIELYNNGGSIIAHTGDVLIIDANNTRNTSLIQADGGSITVTRDIDDWYSQGSVKAINGGIVKIGSELHGAGTNYISNGGTLEVDYFQDGSIIFSGGNNHFILDRSTASGQQGTLVNFGIGDTIDLRDIPFSSGVTFLGYTPNGSNTGGTLQIDGTANILLLGNYSAKDFGLASDATGGTLITRLP
jgi:Domain of unknown function (DUF4347)/FG-GAP-like repeat/RTX calcium-binding nonapeptide repeat (4 copies)